VKIAFGIAVLALAVATLLVGYHASLPSCYQTIAHAPLGYDNSGGYTTTRHRHGWFNCK
jgi:hypothetical protein